jgi:hypothetical protein
MEIATYGVHRSGRIHSRMSPVLELTGTLELAARGVPSLRDVLCTLRHAALFLRRAQEPAVENRDRTG